MNMGQAISSCFSKYATFSGRASRSEYWFFILFYFICVIAVAAFDTTPNGILANLTILAFLIPNYAAGARRMHDVGKNGWFQIIPFYGLILACSKGEGDNQYGPATA
jgi:uncharacterized membrane protein YhaH (DUF805 family)